MTKRFEPIIDAIAFDGRANAYLISHAQLIDNAIQSWDADHLDPRILADFPAYMTKALKFGTLSGR
jgi:hypothetical protein